MWFHGYQGEKRIKLFAICNGLRFEKTIVKSGWKWSGFLDLHLPVSTGNCGPARSYSCKFYVEDTLTLKLDRIYVINRWFEAGTMSYYYRPACRWEDCYKDCWWECGGGNCTTHCKRVCEWRCNPCHPIEHFSWKSAKAPEWAKKPLKFKPNKAAEEYLLRVLCRHNNI